MTIKTISGSYPSGYTLAPTYNGVNVTHTGSVSGITGAAGVSNYSPFGGYGGTGDQGGVGITLPAGGSVTNSGTIAGGQGGAGGNGYVYYYVFSEFITGFIGQGGNGGQGGDGIQSAAVTTIINYGTIAGGNGGAAGNNVGPYAYEKEQPVSGAQGHGIDLTAGGTVRNYGEIRGGIYLGGAGTVVNYGTIQGDYGLAVQFGAPGSVLIAYGGSTTLGGISGNGGALQLMGGTSVGTIEGINGFASVTFADGANWDFKGLDYISTGLAIAPGGKLTVDGTLTTYGSLSGLTNINGTLEVLSGKTLSLHGGTFSNFSGSTLTGGTFAVDAGATFVLPDNDVISTLQGAIDLEGIGSAIQALKTSASAQISIEESLKSIGTAGTLTLGRNWSSDLAMSNAGTIALAGETFTAQSLRNTGNISGWGTIDASTTSTGKISTVWGQTLTFDGPSNSFGGVITAAYAYIPYGTGGTVSLAAGVTTLSTLTLNDTLYFSNAAQVVQNGVVTLDYATITNEAGATWNMANSITAQYSWEIFSNAGLLTKTAGPSLVHMSANFVNTGSITITSGAIDFTGRVPEDAGSVNTFGGTVSGLGTFILGGGANTLASGLALTVAHVTVEGTATTVNVNTNLAYAGQWIQTAGAVSISSGHTLGLTGTGDSLAGVIGGVGRLTTSGTTTVDQMTLGGTAQWYNTALLTETGTLTVGDSLGNKASFVNQMTGEFDLAGNAGIAIGKATTSTFTNQGVLAKTTGGTSKIAIAVTNTGTLEVVRGTLDLLAGVVNSGQIDNLAGATLAFDGDYSITTDPTIKSGQFTNAGLVQKASGAGTSIIRTGTGTLTDTGTIEVDSGILELTGSSVSIAGKITGAGTIEFSTGATTLNTGTTITAAGLMLAGSGAELTVAHNLGYSGTFSAGANTELTIASGALLQVSGSASFFHDTVDGAGRLTTSGTSAVNLVTLGGTAQWFNTGTITETGTLTIGDSAGDKAVFNNQAAGVFDLASNAGIAIGTSTASTFSNQGLVEKTVGGLSTIDIAMTNTGTIEAASGTLDLQQAVTGTGGTLKIDAGKVIQADAAVSGGQTVDFNGGGDRLILTDATHFAGKLQDFGVGDKLDLRQFAPAATTLGFVENAGNTGGTLTVTDGALVAKIALLGQYTASAFHTATDGSSGTFITYTPPPEPALITTPHS